MAYLNVGGLEEMHGLVTLILHQVDKEEENILNFHHQTNLPNANSNINLCYLLHLTLRGSLDGYKTINIGC